jgi:WD40 repeat protein
VAGGLWKGTIRLWNLDTGEETGQLRSDAGPGPYLSFAPDGKTLAAGYCASTKGCTIILWDLTSGKPVHQFRVPASALGSLAFSPNGKTLASLSNGIRLWEAANGKELGVANGGSKILGA